MAKQLQLRRGTTLQNNAFIGAVGEPTLDTETGMIHIHDGVTQGGKDFIDPVVAFQKPTAENNYTWYRKYASGWVEQGGMNSYGTGTTSNTVIQLLVPMASSRYDTITSAYEGAATSLCPVIAKPMDTSTATTLEVLCCYSDGGTLHAWGGRFTWRVSGMAA